MLNYIHPTVLHSISLDFQIAIKLILLEETDKALEVLRDSVKYLDEQQKLWK